TNKLKANKAKKEKSILKEKLKTLSDLEAEAKKSFQRYVRLRDKDLPCISCNNLNTNDWAGGHYFSAGIYSGLMFDERNCHKQCNTHCN
ncbi:MAG: recombination protein NinG, partial [Candidatus Nanopelagicaceae bacterium]